MFKFYFSEKKKNSINNFFNILSENQNPKMNSALLALLQANGCDQQIFDPPDDFEISPGIIDQDELFSSFNPTPAYNLVNDQDEETSRTEDDYLNMRHAYINEVHNQEKRDENVEKLKEFEQIAREGSPDELLELFRKKHIWKKAVCQMQGKFDICEDELCSNIALPGSKYCPNHIHLDSEQKLFIQCPNCHRNHPKMIRCPSCNV